MLAEEWLEDEDEGVVAVDEGDAVIGATGGAAVAVHVDGDVLAQGRHVALPVARTKKRRRRLKLCVLVDMRRITCLPTHRFS